LPQRSSLSATAVACALVLAPIGAGRAQTPTMQQIVDLYSNASIASGFEAGIEVALIIGSNRPNYFTYGSGNASVMAVPRPTWDFQIGSLTKVFTSNLLAQAAHGGLPLSTTTLGSLSKQLGGTPANQYTQEVTLQDLADFSAGLPRNPPLCASGQSPQTTGCLPSPRPKHETIVTVTNGRAVTSKVKLDTFTVPPAITEAVSEAERPTAGGPGKGTDCPSRDDRYGVGDPAQRRQDDRQGRPGDRVRQSDAAHGDPGGCRHRGADQ